MKRAEIEEQKRTTTNLINRHTEYLKELETMTPDEDKPVVMSWYTVCFVDWVLHVDQWLDASNDVDAIEYCKKKYIIDTNILMQFQAPVWWLEVKHCSFPF